MSELNELNEFEDDDLADLSRPSQKNLADIVKALPKTLPGTTKPKSGTYTSTQQCLTGTDLSKADLILAGLLKAEQSWESAPRAVQQLLENKLVRELVFRPAGPSNTFGDVRKMKWSRSNVSGSCIAHCYQGEWMKDTDQCDGCRAGFGPFTKCVTFSKRCTNCYYRPSACSFDDVDDKDDNDDDVMEIEPVTPSKRQRGATGGIVGRKLVDRAAISDMIVKIQTDLDELTDALGF